MGSFFKGYKEMPKVEPKKFIIVCYEGEGMALVEVEGNRAIMSGDYYHDKIDDLIDGFFIGLDYAGITYEKESINKKGYVHDDTDYV